MFKKMLNKARFALTLGATSAVAMADTVLPADIGAKFTDGTTDIKTVIGLIFGVLVVILVYRMVKKVF